MTSLYETFVATLPAVRCGLPRELFPNETRVGRPAVGWVECLPRAPVCLGGAGGAGGADGLSGLRVGLGVRTGVGPGASHPPVSG